MGIYRYTMSDAIDQISIKKAEDGGMRAYLHAGEKASADALLRATELLRQKHYVCVPTSYEGRSVLEVRGFTRDKQLLDLLYESKAIVGPAAFEQDHEKPLSIGEKIKNRSFLTSGLFYVIGDFKFISYGHKGGSPLDMAGGAFYGLGTASNLLFNRKSNSDLQVQDIAKHMANYLNKQHLPLPKEAALNCIVDDHKKGLIRKADDLFRRYPVELMHAFTALAGVCIAIAAHRKNLAGETVEEFLHSDGFKEYVQHNIKRNPHFPIDNVSQHAQATKLVKHHRTANWLDIGLGSMTFASGMFGALVKEKAHDPDAPKKEGVAGAWEWMREHPLTVSGIGLMVSTMCHAASTVIEYRIGTTNAKKAVFDRGVFVVTNLMAELLIAISSKGHGEGVVSDKTIDNSIISLAADMIVKQPVEQQPQLIEYLSGFLGRKDVLALRDRDVKNDLIREVEIMRKNPWATCHGSVAPAIATNEKPADHWQNMVQPKATAQTPAIS